MSSTGVTIFAQQDSCFDKSVTPQFLLDLLPAGEKTELLFHVSYLCLGKFPQLEKILRANAVEAQMVFNSSEALLMQCVSTSYNLVKTLFPLLITAVEKQNAILAIRFLEKARKWIETIIREVDEMVAEYGKLNRGVASATSDVNRVKVETDSLVTQTTKGYEALIKKVETIQTRLEKAKVAMSANEAELKKAEESLKAKIDDVASRDRKFGLAAAIVPIFGILADSIQKAINSPEDRASMEKIKITMDRLQKDRVILANDVGRIESELMHAQFQVTTYSITLNAIPDPVHLPEVQANLSRIQQILLQLKSFWEKIKVLVIDLEQKTFAAEDLLDFLSDPTFRKDFIDSISMAAQAWTSFRIGCSDVVGIFNSRNKDAYKFLEINPSTLSPQEWQKQYDALQKKLNIFYSNAAIEGKQPQAAIGK